MSINTRNKLAGVFMALVMALGVGVVAPQPASAAYNDLSITNVGSISMKICRVAATKTKCAESKGTGVLNKGQNSKVKYGWKDTDMIYLYRNQCLNGYHGPLFKGPRYVKTGGNFGFPLKFSIRKC